ncbi:MAG TPA: PAS domain-containing protein, partial [Rhodocyclaceae bacterium]|nr:PAS domain-containing protein [Rhodocyclaceae bacterium]
MSCSGPTPYRATRGWQRGQLLVPLAVGLGAAALASLVAIVDSRSELTGSWLIVVSTIGAIGLLTGFATRSHMQARAEAEARRQHEISTHLDVLDGVVAVGAPLSEPASAEMLERIDASVRQAELLRAVAEGVHGIEALFDLAGRLIWISPSIERVTGRTPAQCMNADDALALLVHESDLGYCRSMAQKVAQGGAEGEFEIRLVGEDGEVRWIACCWRRIETDGAAAGLRMSAEDVQGRKETEYKLLETVAELRRSQALREHYLARSNDERRRLIALLNAIRLGILFMDRDRRVLYYNRAMLDI